MRLSLYVRTSKCGSSSIRATFRDLAHSTRTVGSEHHTAYRFSERDADFRLHMILFGQVGPYARLQPHVFSSAWKFAVVRNPWDRAVSAYSYCRRRGALPASVSFRDYVRIDFAEMDEFVFTHSLPLFDILAHDGDCRYLDFIARFERLQADFDFACSRIGLPPTPLPHRHRTQHGDYRSYYGRDDIARIAAKYRRDIDAFGYTFE